MSTFLKYESGPKIVKNDKVTKLHFSFPQGNLSGYLGKQLYLIKLCLFLTVDHWRCAKSTRKPFKIPVLTIAKNRKQYHRENGCLENVISYLNLDLCKISDHLSLQLVCNLLDNGVRISHFPWCSSEANNILCYSLGSWLDFAGGT